VEDPDLEQELVDEEWTGKLPILRLFKGLKRAIADEDWMEAMNIIAQLKMMQAQGQGVMPESLDIETPPFDAGAAEAGMAPSEGETGLPSTVLPSETTGRFPPGAKGAKMPAGAGEV
jgi:hypothetical protein